MSIPGLMQVLEDNKGECVRKSMCVSDSKRTTEDDFSSGSYYTDPSIIHTRFYFHLLLNLQVFMANVLQLMSDISHGENWVERVLGLSL